MDEDMDTLPQEGDGHVVTVSATEVFCVCGWKRDTLTGSEALRLGYNHARKNGLAPLHDTRLEPERKNVFDG